MKGSMHLFDVGVLLLLLPPLLLLVLCSMSSVKAVA